MVYIWVILGIIFLFLELLNPGLIFFISFFFGSCFALLGCWFDVNLSSQLALFFGLSCVAGYCVYILLKKKQYINSNHGLKTNYYALQGKQALVVEAIQPNSVGIIKVGGELWSAQTKRGQYCKEGSEVEIIEVVGCHCIVRLMSEIA